MSSQALSHRCRRASRDRRLIALATVVLTVGLSGCENAPGLEAGRLDVRAAIARGDLHSPRAAAMAVASIDGAPAPIVARLQQDMASEAANREITITDPALARYFVRGYLDASPSEKGTSVHYVWDVFDATRQRTQRLDDTFDIPASDGSDPWDGVNDEVVASIAARTADDLALFLGKTPEATGSPAQTAEAGIVAIHTPN